MPPLKQTKVSSVLAGREGTVCDEKVWETVLAANDLAGSLCHELQSEISQPACDHPCAQSYNMVSRLVVFLPSN